MGLILRKAITRKEQTESRRDSLAFSFISYVEQRLDCKIIHRCISKLGTYCKGYP